MKYSLNEIEARILGVLIEKQMATPDYYPLTLNALVNACNQKSNRNPVMSLDEDIVEQALNSLREKHLVWQVKTHGSRTAKFEHNMKEVADLSTSEIGILCVLLVRGPQTAGELRSRTTRLVEFHGLAAVEHNLKKLADHDEGPFIEKLKRMPGQKECRYTQRFCITEQKEITSEQISAKVEENDTAAKNDRIDELEEKLNELRTELHEFKITFNEFKKQFE